MAVIYRRNPHGSGRLTTTIPLHHNADGMRHGGSLDIQDHAEDDDDDIEAANGRIARLLQRCRRWRRRRRKRTSTGMSLSTTAPTPLSTRSALAHRICQILWLALLVYSFFGLPVLGRILNIARYFHRFTVLSVLTGLFVGFLQDFAIFLQASTLFVLVKMLFQPLSLQRRLSSTSAATTSTSASSSSGLLGGSTAMAALAQERYPRQVHLPVYFPVRTNDFELHGASASGSSHPALPSVSSTASTASTASALSETDTLDLAPTSTTTVSSGPGGVGNTSSLPFNATHLTLVASSNSAATTFPWSLSSSTSPPLSPSSVLLLKLRALSASTLALALVFVVVVLSTVASVADFCLQVTMHPRLNRAFVEIFVNYMSQFTASLLDEEVLTPAVVFAWGIYLVLAVLMTYGFFTERLPLLPDVLSCVTSSSNSSSSCCTRRVKRLATACCGFIKRRSAYRKDSSVTLPSSSTETSTSGFMQSLYKSYWRRKDSDIVIIENGSSAPTMASTSGPPSGPRGSRRRRSSSAYGYPHGLLMGGNGFGTSSLSTRFGWLRSGSMGHGMNTSSSTWMTPKSPFGVVLLGIIVSLFVTLGALCASLIVHTTTAPSKSNSITGHSLITNHRAVIGVDMQLMSNPMFSLQTEPFFTRKSRVGADHINCTAASSTLLSTLGKSEVFESIDANEDTCALLWRKTTAYEGETFWDIGWNTTSSPTGEVEGTAATGNTTTKQPPNIIVINMESWRYLDVGVLGGSEKKAKFGKSATPNFDRLTQEGVLYRKHYTQCVQTTRTLLTTLFGMLPSCTETTALKMYGTGLTVRGLPQFLKSQGYFNMFWSAVDLTWEYWDKFLLMNGFDKLVDDQKVRKMLHDVRSYKDREDDHFSWGMHDHLSFDMLLHALEVAKNNSQVPRSVSLLARNAPVETSSFTNATHTDSISANQTETRTRVDDDGDDATDAPKKLKETPGASPPGSVAPPKTMSNDSKSEEKRPSLPGWEGLREPYFINMYTITSHNPWALPDDYTVPDLHELYTPFNKRYIDAMYFSDEMLGKFIDRLRAKGLMKNTVVIIEGDHGYGRLEHDNNPSIADSALYDEATHVPFLILADDYLQPEVKGTTVDQLTMQSDLMATIADIVGVSDTNPLLQHGLGHSMRRKRRTPMVRDVGFAAIHADEKDKEKERRVVLCNPFNGLTKGVRTEELKYVYNPDGSYKVFELARDAAERNPRTKGYDYEQMDDVTRDMLEFVTQQVDLTQFLYETNKFVGAMPKTNYRYIVQVEATSHTAIKTAGPVRRIGGEKQGEEEENARTTSAQPEMATTTEPMEERTPATQAAQV